MNQNDSFTKILLHFDGTNGSTTATDSNIGGAAHTWTAGGNAQLNTATVKFGSAAGLFDGAGDYFTTPDHADFTLGAGNWTVDFWFNASGSFGVTRRLAGQIDNAGSVASNAFGASMLASNVIQYSVSNGAANTQLAGTTAITTAGWHHFAAVRSGNTLYLFLDGVQQATAAFTGSIVDSSNSWSVGRIGDLVSATEWVGSIDEFRLSVGIARWTANFTPPGSAYVDERATVGSFALTGITAPLKPAMAAAAASDTVTGQAAVLTPKAVATVGAFAETGQAALLSINGSVTAGAYALTGNAAALTPAAIAGAGSYAFSGVAAPLTGSLAATPRSYAISWQGFSDASTFAARAGTFTLTGGDGYLSYDIDLGGVGGSIVPHRGSEERRSGAPFTKQRFRELIDAAEAAAEAERRVLEAENARKREAATKAAAEAKVAIAAARRAEDRSNAARAQQRALADALAAQVGAQRTSDAMRDAHAILQAAQAAHSRIEADQEEEEAIVQLLFAA